MKRFLLLAGLMVAGLTLHVQAQNAFEIIQKSEDKVRGKTSRGVIQMTIIRPDWTREMKMKMWSRGDDYSLILVTSPAREKGTAFLRRKRELWNWQPSIDRVIKFPPSMMAQSWMGSDFSNDDLVKQSSIKTDYTHTFLEEEVLEGRPCYQIELVPKPDAPVVWGKIVLWVDKKDYLQLKTEFYDEDLYLLSTITGSNVKSFSGRLLPARLEVVPAEEEGQKTVIEYLELAFDAPIKDRFFTIQNMKRLR